MIPSSKQVLHGRQCIRGAMHLNILMNTVQHIATHSQQFAAANVVQINERLTTVESDITQHNVLISP